MIIEKKVCDLKPGDILPNMRNGPQRVVLGTRATAAGPHTLMVAALGLGALADGFTRIAEYKARPEAMMGVEVPDLTPAQQHADELAALLREAHDFIRAGSKEHRDSNAQFGVISGLKAKWRTWEPQVDALLKRIDPPQPPTLEEALNALAEVRDRNAVDGPIPWSVRADALLDRARRHGML